MIEPWHLRLFLNGLAEVVRVEGMRAENEICKHQGEPLQYGQDSFDIAASTIESISHELANS